MFLNGNKSNLEEFFILLVVILSNLAKRKACCTIHFTFLIYKYKIFPKIVMKYMY